MAAIYERAHTCGDEVWRMVIRVGDNRRFCLSFSSFDAAHAWAVENERWVRSDVDRALRWREEKYSYMREKRLNEHEGIVFKRFGKVKNG